MRNVMQHAGSFRASQVKILSDALDPNAGNAAHRYEAEVDQELVVLVKFQRGPCNAYGRLTGATEASLAAILVDRLECLQAGALARDSDAQVLAHFRAGLDLLRQHATARK